MTLIGHVFTWFGRSVYSYACGYIQEYPNESGAGNAYSSADAANLLSFFKSLRSALGSSKIISAAVTPLPWLGSNGDPLTDVSAYASVMTYANIMSVVITPYQDSSMRAT